MKQQILFSRKNKKNIISLSSAEYHSMVCVLVTEENQLHQCINTVPSSGLTFTALLANSADNKLIFFLFFPENRI